MKFLSNAINLCKASSIKWKCYNISKYDYENQSYLKPDNVLQNFIRAKQEGFLASWIQLPPNQNYQIMEQQFENTSGTRLLWIFEIHNKSFDTRELELITSGNFDKTFLIQKTELPHNDTLHFSVVKILKLFSEAFKNQLEFQLQSKNYIRAGDCFIQPRFSQLSNFKVNFEEKIDSSLSFSFDVFIAEDSLYLLIFPQKNTIRPLQIDDFNKFKQKNKEKTTFNTPDSNDNVIVTPYNIIGIVEDTNLSELESVENLDEWKELHGLSNNLHLLPISNINSEPSLSVSLSWLPPKLISVNVNGISLKYPISLLYKYINPKMSSDILLEHFWYKEMNLEYVNSSVYSNLGKFEKLILNPKFDETFNNSPFFELQSSEPKQFENPPLSDSNIVKNNGNVSNSSNNIIILDNSNNNNGLKSSKKRKKSATSSIKPNKKAKTSEASTIASISDPTVNGKSNTPNIIDITGSNVVSNLRSSSDPKKVKDESSTDSNLNKDWSLNDFSNEPDLDSWIESMDESKSNNNNNTINGTQKEKGQFKDDLDDEISQKLANPEITRLLDQDLTTLQASPADIQAALTAISHGQVMQYISSSPNPLSPPSVNNNNNNIIGNAERFLDQKANDIAEEENKLSYLISLANSRKGNNIVIRPKFVPPSYRCPPEFRPLEIASNITPTPTYQPKSKISNSTLSKRFSFHPKSPLLSYHYSRITSTSSHISHNAQNQNITSYSLPSNYLENSVLLSSKFERIRRLKYYNFSNYKIARNQPNGNPIQNNNIKNDNNNNNNNNNNNVLKKQTKNNSKIKSDSENEEDFEEEETTDSSDDTPQILSPNNVPKVDPIKIAKIIQEDNCKYSYHIPNKYVDKLNDIKSNYLQTKFVYSTLTSAYFSLLLSDSYVTLFPPKSKIHKDFVQLKGNSKANFLKILNQQAISNYDGWQEGCSESGLISSLSVFHCLSERLQYQGIHERISDEYLSIYEPHSSIDLALDPLTQSVPFQISKNILTKLTPILTSMFGYNTNHISHQLELFSHFYAEKIEVPKLLVGYKENWIEVAPSDAAFFWEKTNLQPYASPKNFNYFVLAPNFSNQIPSIKSSIDMFFKELSCIYEVCNLGSHRPFSTLSKYPNGVILFDEKNSNSDPSKGKYYQKFKEFERILNQLAFDLSTQKFYADSSILIYIINPFSHSFAHIELCKLISQTKIAQSTSLNLVFQIIPMRQISQPVYTSNQLKEIAFSVYTKCRRVSKAAKSSEIAEDLTLFEPLFILSKTGSSVSKLQSPPNQNNDFPLSSNNIINQIEERPIIHCAYKRSLNDQWLQIVFTDSKGELFETFSVPIVEQSNFEFDIISIWKYTQHVMTMMEHQIWDIVIGKFGFFQPLELIEWKKLLENMQNSAYNVNQIALISLQYDRKFQYMKSTNGSNFTPIFEGAKDSTRTSFQRGSNLFPPSASYIVFPSHSNYLFPSEVNSIAFAFLISQNCQEQKDDLPTTLKISLHELFRFSVDGFEDENLRVKRQSYLREIIFEYNFLSWLTVSPNFLNRRSSLPLHFASLFRSIQFNSLIPVN